MKLFILPVRSGGNDAVFANTPEEAWSLIHKDRKECPPYPQFSIFQPYEVKIEEGKVFHIHNN